MAEVVAFPVSIDAQLKQFKANIAIWEEKQNLFLTGYFIGVGIDPVKNRIDLVEGGYTVVPKDD